MYNIQKHRAESLRPELSIESRLLYSNIITGTGSDCNRQIVKRTNISRYKIVNMSKSRILPCETAQNILWDLWIVQGIKSPIWLFGAKNIRQQYLQSSLDFTSICINKQNFRYHLTSAIHIDIIQTVSKKKSLLLQHILIFMKEGFYHGNYKEDCC